MPFIAISDDLKEIIDIHSGQLKNEFLTYKLFADSAIRDKLRRMGIDAGQDEIIPHLEKLEQSKSRHLDKQAVAHAIRRHKQRVARNKRNMQNL